MKLFVTRIRNYFSLVRFSHTIFAMPFALLGFFTGISTTPYGFTWRLLILVVLCMVFARNAAMGFNRYADHRFDRMNPRTAGREIPSGLISPRSALIFVIINSILFITATAFINRLTLFLSPLALAVILAYSLTKRFTSFSHIFLGLALSLAPTGAYISVSGKFDLVPVIYSLVVLCWVSGFDIIYSLQDTEFDLDNELFSVPAKLGIKQALILSGFLHSLAVVFVISSGLISGAGLLYWAGMILFTALLVWEHLVLSPEDRGSITKAFGTINSYAGLLFCAFAIADLYIPLSL
ncbi:MAG: putative 4-hydroxybenzoate polyprenyltransferase [Bacteroidales bacterium]|nr:putative 4-hydroxybenzoate polyprenyltransferase [Bacteroidales bacterium]